MVFLQQGYKSTLAYLVQWISSGNHSTVSISPHAAADEAFSQSSKDSEDSKSILYVDDEEYEKILCSFKIDNVTWFKFRSF